MANPKLKAKGVLQIDAYKVLMTAIEDGIGWGLQRADKHATDPLTDAQRARLREHLELEIGNAICDILVFK